MKDISYISIDELESILEKHGIGTNRYGEWNASKKATLFVKILHGGNELQNEQDWIKLIYPSDEIENITHIWNRETEVIRGIHWIPCYIEELVSWAIHMKELPCVERCFIGNIVI